jgi:hypothetical protein
MRLCSPALALLLVVLVASTPTARPAELPPSSAPAQQKKVDYNRDVRPILADNCFKCHGPDEKQRKAQLRLDTREGLLAATAGGNAVVPGHADKSEVIARITATETKSLMPPVKSAKKLTAEQIATLKAWIDQGATWSSHWAFTKPVRPKVPESSNSHAEIHNPIDNFILARLEHDGLTPALPADKVTVLRRVTLDLTGLPPTPEEVDAFLKDDSPQAYEKVVDRLLASPRFGERMAWRWLEAARYADTNGYQTDAGRDMWRWRDWVIEAYNRNLPFDRFTIEQLAGDLLPTPTLDQRIATGFNRNHRGNAEGGIVPEEYAVEYVADRVETTATVWLGLTFTCCRCHDHKFDPFLQKDFYRLFAFFNNVPEKGRAVKFGNSPPFIKAPTREQEKKLAELDRQLQGAEKRAGELRDEIVRAQEKWESSVAVDKLPDWSPRRGLLAAFALDDPGELKAVDGKAVFAPGKLGKAADLDGTRYLAAEKAGDFGFDERFSLSCWVLPRKPNGAIVSRGVDDPQGEGYGLYLANGKLQAHFTKRWLDDALRLETPEALPLDRWSHIVVTYDGFRLAAGVKVYINGTEVKTRVLLDELNQTFQTKEPFRIGSGSGRELRFNGLIDDVRIYDRVLDADVTRILAVAETPAEILRKPAAKRSSAEAAKLRAFFLENAAPKPIREALDDVRRLRDERQKFWESIPTVMVMEEMANPRETHILSRGEYDKKGEKVTAGVPGALSPFPAGVPNNRLGFARWLTSPENPLTARVAVNRAWQMHFGTGLVKTAEDFGTQGAFPTHSELLDWLAVEFSTDWDIKRLHKLIVMSATYRQSSRITKESLARDPESKLLTRFPRLRLSADMLRDQALFTSGLLVEKLGGPSARPYQPAGLWNELSGTGDYTQDTGEGLYRRSLYTYWKRTSPPPVMSAFDAAGRETCWVRENRTNTPLQALTLLNETAFVEASRALAQRVMHEGKTSDDRLTQAFRRVTGRTPAAKELEILRKNFDFHFAEFRDNTAAAKKLLAIGASKPDPKLDPSELAAYSAVCNMLLNLDEVLTKE